jgi:uncharacterized protein (DUF2336 family)
MPRDHPLVKLAADPSEAAREALVAATAGQLLDSTATPTQSELDLFCDVLVRLYSFARQEIRQRLSATLALAQWAPPNLLRALALDTIEIAQPIITLSPVLTDDIMLEVIEKCEVAHKVCLADRPAIGEAITHQLVKSDNPRVVATIARNPTARISAQDFHKAINALRDRDEDLDTLILRHDLPPSLIATAYSLAGTQAKLALNVRLPERLGQRLSRVTAFVAADAADGHTDTPLSNQLHAEVQANVRRDKWRTTPGFVIATLMRGEKELFFKSIANLLQLPCEGIVRLLDGNDPYTIALVTRACRFDITIARTIFETLDTTGRTWTLADDRMVAMLWMRNSTSAARLQVASSLPAEAKARA